MFAYCLNSPVNLVDPCGGVPIFNPYVISGLAIIGGIITNHIINKDNMKKINKEIKDSYTKDEAIEEIEDILADYGNDISVTFHDSNVQINNSHNVDSRYDRQKVSAIITRTENYTNRNAGNLSAEWNAHNAMFFVPWWTEPCRNVNLDYTRDSRLFV